MLRPLCLLSIKYHDINILKITLEWHERRGIIINKMIPRG